MKHFRLRADKKIIPVLAAACFFLISCICAFVYADSSEKQAERILTAAYTADGAWAAAENESAHSELYSQKFDFLATEKGIEGLKQLKLPYGLMEKGKKVEKTYASVIMLKPVKKIAIGDAPEKGQEAKQKHTQAFTYEIRAEIYFDKGNEVMQPVETERYAGTIYMVKTGFMTWKMEGLTGRRTQ